MRILVFLILGLGVCCCKSGDLRIPLLPAVHQEVSPIFLQDDTVKVYFEDYFPSVGIKKVIPSDGLKVIRDKQKQSLELLATSPEIFFFNLKVRIGDYAYDIPVIQKDRMVEGDSLQLMTDIVKGDTIILRCSQPVSGWEVYLDNYKLTTPVLIPTDTTLAIVLPAAAKVLKYAKLRVWATDTKRVSGVLVVPIQEGRLVTDPVVLESQEKSVAIWFQKINKYELANNSSREELVCLLADKLITDKTEIDSTVSKSSNYHGIFSQSMALIAGDYIPLRIEKQVFAYLRSYFSEEWIVIANKRSETTIYKLDLPQKDRKVDFKSLFGNRFSYDNNRLIVDVPANDIEVIHN